MTINRTVIRKLWANSGGYCANPNCRNDLFPFFDNRDITNIEELAHIIGKKRKGPRGQSDLNPTQRDSYDNIIILCPNCHSLIDKNPKLFPENTLFKWKKCHYDSIKEIFSVKKFTTKLKLREYLNPLIEENKSIFNSYGPFSIVARQDPMSTELNWERLAIQKILPNNRTIEKTIEANMSLLSNKEREIFNKFKIHREGFEFNKLSGDVNSAVIRYPEEFENILT